MRSFTERPTSLVDPVTHALRTGSFRGGIPRVDPSPLGRSRLFRLLHEKRWFYLALAADPLFIGAAVVRLGYGANSFAFALDRETGRMAGRFSAMAPRFAAKVGQEPSEGCFAHFHQGYSRVSIERGLGERDYRIEIVAPELRVSARMSTAGAPPPIGVIAALPGPPNGLFNATQKGVLLPLQGEAIVEGRHHDLNGGLGGYDYTAGYQARHTVWRWGFLLGYARTGERVGLNLVEGFIGEAECTVWIDGEPYPLSAGRFEFDEQQPMAPWRVTTTGGEVDLRFEPGGLHAERHNFGVIATKFMQPSGTYKGTVTLPGRAPLIIDGALGVAEDQDTLW